MTPRIKELIDDTVTLTGAAPPPLMEADAPVLAPAAISGDGLYLVGVIGGKDVGKSSLINALVGWPITEQSAEGPGTEMVIAYAHRDSAGALQRLLEREVPGQFRIVTHDVAGLSKQVLLDLPDIDSHWAAHVALTRRMLRHLLFPLWVQSVEKYADLQPQRLLAQVAAGNDPSNFLFCLNKADQVLKREGAAAVESLRADFADRLARTLSLPSAPKVFLVSAAEPSALDLPELAALLSKQKRDDSVKQSRQLAGRRQDRSLVAWLDQQGLSDRAERSARLLSEAEELAADRIAAPLLEQALPRLMSDPAYRLGLIEPVTEQRMARWPLVNMIQTAVAPAVAIVRRNVADAPPGDPQPDAYLPAGSRSLAAAVQATFALLQQSHPNVASVYRGRPLWDAQVAAQAVTSLQQRLRNVSERQREEAGARVGSPGILGAPLRWLLTIGAALWFPIVQPVLSVALQPGFKTGSRELGLLVVQLLSAAYLLRSVGFLVLWFAVLWAWLRWNTHRRVSRLITAWSAIDAPRDLSLQRQVMEWIDELLDPIREDADRTSALADRLAEARKELERGA